MGLLSLLKGPASRQPKTGESFVFHGRRYTITEIAGRTFTAYHKFDSGKTSRPTGNLADLVWHDRAGAWTLPGREGDLTSV